MKEHFKKFDELIKEKGDKRRHLMIGGNYFLLRDVSCVVPVSQDCINVLLVGGQRVTMKSSTRDESLDEILNFHTNR